MTLTLTVLRFSMNNQMPSKLKLMNCALYRNRLPMSRMIAALSTNSVSKAQATENYFEKNERLKRPLSPHLTIYKPQLTSMLSITHRGTGFFLAACLSGFSIGMLILPQSFPYYLGLVESVHFGPVLIFLAKYCLSFPFCYHALNGVRHLVWDMGYGFSLPVLYKSGWFVLGTSLALGAIVAAM